MSEPVRVGLIGAGPWANVFTGPMLAGSHEVDLVGVWARRPEAAAVVAAASGAQAFASLPELFDTVDAVCCSVPPSVQADLAARAAAAGKAVLLDKPVGATVAEAEGLADAIARAGVVSQVLLTNRYLPAMRTFLDGAATFGAYGGRACFFGDGCLEGTFFGTPWRVAEGGLLDLGPHVLDALDAALGHITGVQARGDVHRLVLLECAHEGGAVSQAAISATTRQAGGLAVELHGEAGRLELDLGALSPEEFGAEFAAAQRTIVHEFAAAVRAGRPHALDVQRGLHLQRLIDDAARQLRR